jgi:hypothetical protein
VLVAKGLSKGCSVLQGDTDPFELAQGPERAAQGSTGGEDLFDEVWGG